VLINFLYSYHLYLHNGQIEGIRVENKILAKLCSLLGEDCPMRLGVHGKADLVEAVVAYCFLNNLINFEEILALIDCNNFLERLFQRCIETIKKYENLE
jgi:hypothetical protein